MTNVIDLKSAIDEVCGYEGGPKMTLDTIWGGDNLSTEELTPSGIFEVLKKRVRDIATIDSLLAEDFSWGNPPESRIGDVLSMLHSVDDAFIDGAVAKIREAMENAGIELDAFDCLV